MEGESREQRTVERGEVLSGSAGAWGSWVGRVRWLVERLSVG